jgi:hypothetical protein
LEFLQHYPVGVPYIKNVNLPVNSRSHVSKLKMQEPFEQMVRFCQGPLSLADFNEKSALPKSGCLRFVGGYD